MIQYKCGYKYQLVASHTHRLPVEFEGGDPCTGQFLHYTPDGLLTIRSGYAWDGPSGPSWDTKSFMRASLIHDAIYQMLRHGLLPRELKDAADREMQRICIEDGMSRFRAWYCYQAVSKFGMDATIQHRDILVAP